jgi:hypothetical protein
MDLDRDPEGRSDLYLCEKSRIVTSVVIIISYLFLLPLHRLLATFISKETDASTVYQLMGSSVYDVRTVGRG